MPYYINVGGGAGTAWKPITKMYINVGGGSGTAWKPVTTSYINVGGGAGAAWKPYFTTTAVPSYKFLKGSTIYVTTNGFIDLDLGTVQTIENDGARAIGILPADLIQDSLKYYVDADITQTYTTYIYWSGHRATSTTANEIAYEIWMPFDQNYAYVQISFPSGTYSGTGYWYNKAQATFSGTRTTGKQWKITFDQTVAVTGPVNSGTYFSPKGSTWTSWVNTNNVVSSGNTNDGYTAIVTGLLAPTFGPVTSTSDGFYADITNYDSTYIYNATVTAGSVAVDTITNKGRVTVTGLTSGGSATVSIYASKTGWSNSDTVTLVGGTLAAPVYSALTPGLALWEQKATGFSVIINNYDNTNYLWTSSITATSHTPSTDVKSSISGAIATVSGLLVGETATIQVNSTVRSGVNTGSVASATLSGSAAYNSPSNVSLSVSGSNYKVTWTDYKPTTGIDSIWPWASYTLIYYTSTDGSTFSYGGAAINITTNSYTFAQSVIGSGPSNLYVTVTSINSQGGIMGAESPSSNSIANPLYVAPPPSGGGGTGGGTPSVSGSASNITASGATISWTVSNLTQTGWSLYAPNPYTGAYDQLVASGSTQTSTSVTGNAATAYTYFLAINKQIVGWDATTYVSFTTSAASPPPGGGGGTPPPPPPPAGPPPSTGGGGKSNSIGITTLIRTPGGLVPAGSLNIGDTLISANITGFPNDPTIEFGTNWTDQNPEITLEETQIVYLHTRISQDAVAINDDLFSDGHQVLIKRDGVAKFVMALDVTDTDYIYNYSTLSWDLVYMAVVISAPHEVISIGCEPYDMFFTQNMLVHDTVAI